MDQATDPVTGRPATGPLDSTQTSRDPDAIADDIRGTRAEMDETISALSDKLSPSHLIDEAKDAFTSSARDAGSSMLESFKDSSFLDTIKENPIPAAAVGLSVAWFLSKMGESESERYRYERYRATGDPYYAPRRPMRYGYDRYAYDDDRYGDGATRRAGGYGQDESLTDKASDALDTAKDTASDAVDAVKDKAGDLASSAKHALSGSADAAGDHARGAGRQLQRAERRAESWLDHQMQANPLAVGAVALAAGALVGLSVPETDAEHRAFGDEADQVKRQLGEVASEKADQVKAAATDLAEEAGSKAQSVAEKAKTKGQAVADTAKDKAQNVADDAKGTADKAASEAQKKATSSGSAGKPTSAGSKTPSPAGSTKQSTTTGKGTVATGKTVRNPNKP